MSDKGMQILVMLAQRKRSARKLLKRFKKEHPQDRELHSFTWQHENETHNILQIAKQIYYDMPRR